MGGVESSSTLSRFVSLCRWPLVLSAGRVPDLIEVLVHLAAINPRGFRWCVGSLGQAALDWRTF